MASPWIGDIKQMLSTRSDFKVSWVSRYANVVVHKLAKVGVGDELCNVWELCFLNKAATVTLKKDIVPVQCSK